MKLDRLFLLLLTVGVLSGAVAHAADKFTPPGPNVARGKSYTMDPAPDYDLSTDQGDVTNLTDGAFAPELLDGQPVGLWVHKQTVGWKYKPYVTVTFDLGADTPIAGLSWSTAAAWTSEVMWPVAILVAVSQDGTQYRLVDDLVRMSGKFGPVPDVGRHKFVTDGLRTHGRYLRLIAVASGPFVFADEIEVYRGPDHLLGAPVDSPVLDNVSVFLATNQIPMAVRNWVNNDLIRARAEVAASPAPAAARARAAAVLDEVGQANTGLIAPPGDDFRATLPLTTFHGRIFSALGALRAAEKRPALQLWHRNRWEIMSPWTRPTKGKASQAALQVRMIRNERRAETLNISNNTASPIRATVWIEGLPGGTAPGYVSLRECPYVAQRTETWDANALPEVTPAKGKWQVTLPAGLARHLWLAFYPPASFTPGTYRGKLVVQPERGQRLQAPLTLTVEYLVYPDEHTLALGMWDYTNGNSQYGLKPSNLGAALKQMQSYGYNVPWASSGVLSSPVAADFDAKDKLTQPLDFSGLDAWLDRWPKAKYYAVYMYVSGNPTRINFAGSEVGGEQFNRRVGAWMRAIAEHLRARGTAPRKLLLLPVDEPGGGDYDRWQYLWARAIKAAVPEFVVFCDPSNAMPHKTGLREMFESADILCPYRQHYVDGGEAVQGFYEELRAGGRTLFMYAIGAGPARNPVSNMRAQSWLVWQMKGSGSFYWAYADTGRYGRPGTERYQNMGTWNTLAPTVELYSPVYLDATSVTDSKSWIAYIEGAQDYEYLVMLRARVEQLEKAGKRGPALDRARKLMATLPEKVIKAATVDGDRTATDRGRLQVLDALLALN